MQYDLVIYNEDGSTLVTPNTEGVGELRRQAGIAFDELRDEATNDSTIKKIELYQVGGLEEKKLVSSWQRQD